jgi:hypothetical protein
VGTSPIHFHTTEVGEAFNKSTIFVYEELVRLASRNLNDWTLLRHIVAPVTLSEKLYGVFLVENLSSPVSSALMILI